MHEHCELSGTACTAMIQFVVATLGRPTVIEGGLLTQVQTHAMEALGPINLAVL